MKFRSEARQAARAFVFAAAIAAALAAPECRAGACGALIETVRIPTSGEVVTSTRALKSGRRFVLRASGMFFIGGSAGLADAEYEFNCDASQVIDVAGPGVDIGIAVDDFRSMRKQPRWGAYNGATHNYVADYVGTGKPAAFRYYDDFYPDNRGSLTVDVFESGDRQACLELPQSGDVVQMHEASALVARELAKCQTPAPSPEFTPAKNAVHGANAHSGAGPVAPGGAKDLFLDGPSGSYPMLLLPPAPEGGEKTQILQKQ